MRCETLVLILTLAVLPSAGATQCDPPCPDRDKDGVVDGIDQCADTEAGAPVTIHGCAHDSDDDGVPDYRDNCPRLPVASVDAWGCPIATEIDLPGLKFEVNSAKILKSSHAMLDDAAEILRGYDNLQIEIAGHTDDSGSAEHNRQLSRLRAAAVRQYLIDAGIEVQSLTARGYGEARPIASNKNDADRAKNRRVVLRILSGQRKDEEQ